MVNKEATVEQERATFRGWIERFAPGVAGSDLIRWIIRFALPVSSHVAVVTDGDRDLLRIGAMTTPFEFDLADESLDPETVIKGLDRLAALGVGYLLLPAPAKERLDRNDRLSGRLHGLFRTVVEEPGICTILAIHNETWERADDDGLPFPPPEMVHLTAGMFDGRQIYERFLQGGQASASCLADILRRYDVDPVKLDSILDYGSGCGRVIRHWPSITNANLAGSDYNPYLAAWCQENLPTATFRTNGIGPGLDFDDEEFDAVYSVSVFTHLTEPLQMPWINELVRVTKPGGYLLLTLHGQGRADLLDGEDRRRFDEGHLVVSTKFRPGTSSCAAFHPERYIRDTFAAGLKVVANLPNGAPFARQDAVLLQKPA